MDAELGTLIERSARPQKLPGLGERLVAAEAALARVSRETGAEPWAVYDAALERGVVPARYLRNLGAFGIEGQLRLHRATAAMVGLGGLGGLALESLARLGVGNIRGADGDHFEDSNLNRQLLCEKDDIGLQKAEAAKRRVARVNPAVRFAGRDEFLAADALAAFVSGADVALDCLGGLAHRAQLEDACRVVETPLVTAAVAGWSGYVAVVPPGRPGPACLMGQGESAEETLGTQPPAIYAASAIMAGEAVRLLLGEKSALYGRMLCFDLARQTWDTVDYC